MIDAETRYSRLLESGVELEKLHPVRMPELPQKLMLTIFQMADVTYGLLNKSWYAEYLKEESKKVGKKLAQHRVARILFPKIVPERVFCRAGLEELNAKIDQLYRAFYCGHCFQRGVESQFLTVNKLLCVERFEQHMATLARLVRDEPLHQAYRPDHGWYACWAGALSMGLFGFAFGLIPHDRSDFIVVCMASALLALMSLREGVRQCRYKTPVQRIEACLKRPLAEVQSLLPPVPMPIDLRID